MSKPNVQQVAYIRVSTEDQSTARQLADKEFDRIFEEKISGGSADRPKLKECLAYLRQGDHLHVHSIDRLARNLLDLEQILEELQGKGVAVTFRKESLSFTGEDNPFQKLQRQIIGAVAEFERSMIRERQREGIAVARKQGKHLGRRRQLTDDQVYEIRRRRGEGVSALARELGVGRTTVYDALCGQGAYSHMAVEKGRQ